MITIRRLFCVTALAVFFPLMTVHAVVQTEGIGVTSFSARTNASGEFRVTHGISGEIYGVLVAIQHADGAWITLERSHAISNGRLWNDQEIIGWIASPDFVDRDVRILVFYARPDAFPTQEYAAGVLTGQTDSQGRFSLPHHYGNSIRGVTAAVLSSPSSNWFAIADSANTDNRLWWNSDEVAGMIRLDNFQNRNVKALVFFERDRDYDHGALNTVFLQGRANDQGLFRLPHDLMPELPAGTRGFRSNIIEGMIPAVRHNNGNWYVIEESNNVRNTFWWNENNFAGQIESNRFAGNEARVLVFYTMVG
ncbi:MAG: hypothetical protein JNL42_12055 [Anaerolineae bacterium]|nr:hypothetical protein [Anaerolineae bacterium]